MIKAPEDSLSSEIPLPGSRRCLLMSSHGRTGEGALQGLFCKGTTPPMGAPPHDLITSQRRHHIPSPWGLGFDVSILGTYSVHSGRETSQQSQPSVVNAAPLSLEHQEDVETEWGVGVRGTEGRAGPGGARAKASMLGGGRWAGAVSVCAWRAVSGCLGP